LVSGPSGCGKSILIDQVCQRSNLNAIHISGATCAESKPGEAERKLRDAFNTAKSSLKGVIIIDQLDVMCPKINDTTLSHTRRLVKQMASLLDQSPSLLVIGVSSRASNVDPTILRAGRIETEISIAPPTEGERKAMLQSLIKSVMKVIQFTLFCIV
jgi:SpoVK/Ycf46/Vps4 family AAA+-type ATPase